MCVCVCVCLSVCLCVHVSALKSDKSAYCSSEKRFWEPVFCMQDGAWVWSIMVRFFFQIYNLWCAKLALTDEFSTFQHGQSTLFLLENMIFLDNFKFSTYSQRFVVQLLTVSWSRRFVIFCDIIHVSGTYYITENCLLLPEFVFRRGRRFLTKIKVHQKNIENILSVATAIW